MTLGARTKFIPRLGDPLTDRELEVLHLTALGRGNHGAARDLNLSVDTAKTHMRKLFVKLGATDRAHLVALAFQAGWLWVGANRRVYAGRDGIPMQALRVAVA